MSDITVVRDTIQSGDPNTPVQLLPLLSEELRRTGLEALGQTLLSTSVFFRNGLCRA